MIGLRTQEKSKFLEFWEIIQKKAAESGKTFFLDCGDGHNYEDEKIECEDLFGWLVDNKKKDTFNKIFSEWKEIGQEWDSSYVSVVWKHTPQGIAVEIN